MRAIFDSVFHYPGLNFTAISEREWGYFHTICSEYCLVISVQTCCDAITVLSAISDNS